MLHVNDDDCVRACLGAGPMQTWYSRMCRKNETKARPDDATELLTYRYLCV